VRHVALCPDVAHVEFACPVPEGRGARRHPSVLHGGEGRRRILGKAVAETRVLGVTADVNAVAMAMPDSKRSAK
jgi:hypothetical protein